jgi:hypothetical protein
MSNICYSTWGAIKSQLLDGLYSTQINFWNWKLAKVIQKNGQFQGVIIPESQAIKSAIQQGSNSWTALPLNWLEVPHEPEYHFPLFLDSPDLIEELDKVTNELTKIKKERYESDRFLSALILYYPTRDQLKDILGDNLYSLCSYVPADTREAIWSPVSLEDFLRMHARILEHMQERVLLNLLMSDIMR